MECVRESRIRSRHRDVRNHVSDRNTEDHRKREQTDIDAEEIRNHDHNISEVDRALSLKLIEQENSVKNEKMKIEGQKTVAKDKVARLFENLRDILSAKENEILESVETEYDISFETINGMMRDIANEKARLQHLSEYGCIEDEDEVHTYLNQNITKREEGLKSLSAPDLALHEDSVQALKNLNIGEIVGSSTEVSNDDNIEQTDIITESTSYSAEPTEFSDSENESNDAVEDDSNVEVSASSLDTNNEQQEYVGETEGATGYSEAEQTVPSAPPLPENDEEPPPSYWQAVGIDQPQTDSQSEVEIPGYYDIPHTNRLPENILQLWHSFPVRRQYDRKGPLVVAMTWNHGRICITDRTNMKVKFFYPNGQLIKEMQFLGYELYDITFLEEVQGEVRYLLTCPKSRLLVILSIDHNNMAQCVRKIQTNYFYTCVCRGPMEQTLIGTDVSNVGHQYRQPSVHVFTFHGEVLTQISHTPSFVQLLYPKAVEVFEHYIVVLDWKLSSVCVYSQDGSGVAEYRGTSESPLVKPLHMTLDHMGNIMILNGEFSNIHVIDLHGNPLEIIKISSGFSMSKLIAFDVDTKRLCLARSNSDLAVFKFQDGYVTLSQRNLAPRCVLPAHSSARREPDVLPLVEGMLPSTIESIASRQPVRNRNRQFHL